MYRDYYLTKNRKFLWDCFSTCRVAIEYVARFDTDADGLIENQVFFFFFILFFYFYFILFFFFFFFFFFLFFLLLLLTPLPRVSLIKPMTHGQQMVPLPTVVVYG